MYKRNGYRINASVFILLSSLISQPAVAHDPVFGLGPHVLFKGGLEIAPEVTTNKAGKNEKTELGASITYGLTGDLAVGVDIPYVDKSDGTSSSSGQGDLSVFTKYRFWRRDGLGLQESIAIAAKLKTDSADNNLGTKSTDGILGLAYGHGEFTLNLTC